MRKIILFDLDYTLYDSKVFINGKIDAYAERFGLYRALVEKKEQEAAEEVLTHYGEFVHEEYAKTVAQLLGIPRRWKEIFEIAFEEDLHKRAVYHEAENVLGFLKRDFRLGLFSQGDQVLQRTKLEKSGLLQYFEENLVFIFGEKIPEIEPLAKKFQVFSALDDKSEVVDEWSKSGIPVAIRVRRGVFSETVLPEKRSNIFEVENLQQAYKLLRSKLPQYF